MPEEPDPDGQISLRYQEFLDAVERLRAVNFPIERDPADAWPDFVGWRATYEQAAYAIAAEVDAVPALWSGPRRLADPAIPPHRPPPGIRLVRNTGRRLAVAAQQGSAGWIGDRGGLLLVVREMESGA